MATRSFLLAQDDEEGGIAWRLAYRLGRPEKEPSSVSPLEALLTRGFKEGVQLNGIHAFTEKMLQGPSM